MYPQISGEDLEIFGKVLSGSTRYWIIVASRDHAIRGVEGGFVQANHGKKAALQRMRKGDWTVFYCPKETFEGKVPCRKFTGLGEIADDLIYQGDMDTGLHPFRKDVRFSPKMKETSIEPLIPDLSFIKNKKSWGYIFRFGLIEIPRADFLRIARKMHTSSTKAS
jgi:predicted RNA-binding protein